MTKKKLPPLPPIDMSTIAIRGLQIRPIDHSNDTKVRIIVIKRLEDNIRLSTYRCSVCNQSLYLAKSRTTDQEYYRCTSCKRIVPKDDDEYVPPINGLISLERTK